MAGKARSTVFYFLCIPLMVIGIRGGLDESTTNIGQVYFSQNQFLNHSAVNPVFSFFASLESTSSDNVVYDFYDKGELKQLTEGLYDNGSVAGDTLLKTQRPNVVVILLESCGSMFLKVMPNLRKAAQEGVEFTNCYGNSYRTDRGTVCALSGYRDGVCLERVSLLPHDVGDENVEQSESSAEYCPKPTEGGLSHGISVWWGYQLHEDEGISHQYGI